MFSPYSRDPAGNCCWGYVVDICVIRGPWVYMECLRKVLDGVLVLDVVFAAREITLCPQNLSVRLQNC